MERDERFTFETSVSTQNFFDKNKINWGAVKYQKQTVSINDFAELIKLGYTFCNCFSDNNEVFGQSVKTLANFQYTYSIMIDIDDSEIEMNALISQLKNKPSIAYTTPNNLTEKSNYLYRYRLCYLLNEKVETIQNYNSIYNAIKKLLIDEVDGFKLKDDCAQSANQQFTGSTEKCDMYISYNVYKLDDFKLSDFPFKNDIEEKKNTLLILNGKIKLTKKPTVKIIDNEFLSDLDKMKPSDLIEKYRTKYHYFTSTELKYNDKGVAIIPSDYIEIYRSWYKADFIKSDGEKKEFTAVKKLKDGEGRRKKLFIAGLIMKKIFPEITFEHLLFNLVNERYYYYINTDKQLSNAILADIAAKVISISIEDIKLNSKSKTAKFKVDKAYCESVLGVSANQYKQVVKKQMNDELIGENYDCSISLKKNILIFKENNIKVGKTKLYEWCKENKIETKVNKKIKKEDIKEETPNSNSIKEIPFKNDIEEKKNTLSILNGKNESETIDKIKEKIINDTTYYFDLNLYSKTGMKWYEVISTMHYRANEIRKYAKQNISDINDLNTILLTINSLCDTSCDKVKEMSAVKAA